MTHYLHIAIALIQVAIPWAALFVIAMSIAAAPDLLTRYRAWRRRRSTCQHHDSPGLDYLRRVKRRVTP